MATYSLVGSDTITIDGRNLADFSDGDVVDVTFPNETVTIKKGKNKNSIFSFNEEGTMVNVVLRLMRSSPDDKYFNSRRIGMENNDFPSFILINANFVKRVGDGFGNVSSEIYTLTGGSFTKGIEGKSNSNGDTDQGVAIYNFAFSNGQRIIT